MAYKIVWSPNAEEDIRQIIGYLMDEWSDDFADVFSNRLVKVLDILEKHPFIGMATQQFTTIRKIAIDKKYTLYYLVLGQEVVVVNVLFNHRKN